MESGVHINRKKYKNRFFLKKGLVKNLKAFHGPKFRAISIYRNINKNCILWPIPFKMQRFLDFWTVFCISVMYSLFSLIFELFAQNCTLMLNHLQCRLESLHSLRYLIILLILHNSNAPICTYLSNTSRNRFYMSTSGFWPCYPPMRRAHINKWINK